MSGSPAPGDGRGARGGDHRGGRGYGRSRPGCGRGRRGCGRGLRGCGRSLLGAALLLSAAPGLAAAQALGDTVSWRLDAAASVAWFEARATLGDFRGESRLLAAWAMAPRAGTLRRLAGGGLPAAEAGAILAHVKGAVAVTVAGFRTGIGARDAHLRETMEAERHPAVVFVLHEARPDPSAARSTDAGFPVLLAGDLSVRGRAFPIEAAARLEASRDGFRLRGRIPIRFTDVGMEPPRRLAGLATVEDDLVLGFDFAFRPEAR